MLALAARAALGAVLLGAALLKLGSARASRSALATFGIVRPRTQWAVWAALVALEALLGLAVVVGSPVGAYVAAGLELALAGALVWALAAGRGGAPCGCFGARSRVRPAGVARNLALAGALAALPALPAGHASREDWLTVGLVAALLAVGALLLLLLALAREVSELRLALGPQSALEIPEEGPEIGSRTRLVESFTPGATARLALAVFSSEGCPLCSSLAPAVSLLERDPAVALRTFDERRDPDAWRSLDVPGAPYAVALDLDGTVLAKGTFNTLPQLESVLATAERRASELAHA